jgi:hypothetical protein
VPPSPAAHCEGESCQGPLQPAPSSGSPLSLTYSGPGDRTQGQRRCGRHKVRRHGHCVKRRRRHGRHVGHRRQRTGARGQEE